MKKKIVFFTGAGVSAESGLATFRESKNGLWNNYRIEDVCTPEAWNKDKKLVLDFYNFRRKQCLEAKPNKAHILIAEFEKDFDVTVITQNVDNLHERAGSSKIIHLHGELMKVRSSVKPNLIYDWVKDVNIGDKCEDGFQLRPHIVWFGESLDNIKIEEAIDAIMKCDFCVILGTSLQVSPANGIPTYLKDNAELFVIDPNDVPINFHSNVNFIKAKAEEGMEVFKKNIALKN